MSLRLNVCGELMKRAVDQLTLEDKKNRDAVYKALGDGIEEYIETWIKQLLLMPTPGLGTVVLPPGSPTGPGPVPIPGAILFK